MEPSSDPRRREIIEAGRRLAERGLIVASQGNISVRADDGLLVTASGVSKGEMSDRHIIETDARGSSTKGGVSSEIPMHVAIYERRPDVRAVVHAHPPAATAFAVAGLAPDAAVLAEAVLLLGHVPLVPYAAPSTGDLAEATGEVMRHAHAALLANHGAVTVGSTLEQAMNRMETLEHLARVTLMAKLLGEPRRLGADEVTRLLSLGTTSYR